MGRTVCLLIEPFYKAGDPPPSGYLQWHSWAKVQYRAGLRQKLCRRCQKWTFPNERCDCPQEARK